MTIQNKVKSKSVNPEHCLTQCKIFLLIVPAKYQSQQFQSQKAPNCVLSAYWMKILWNHYKNNVIVQSFANFTWKISIPANSEPRYLIVYFRLTEWKFWQNIFKNNVIVQSFANFTWKYQFQQFMSQQHQIVRYQPKQVKTWQLTTQK